MTNLLSIAEEYKTRKTYSHFQRRKEKEGEEGEEEKETLTSPVL